MRTVAVANQKGGCGKTTIVINLAACLAREGQRTLAVDLDPQGHCALGLLVPEEQVEVSVSDILREADGAGTVDLGRVTWQISSQFDLIPAKTDLAGLESQLAGVEGREFRLVRALERVREKYDFVIIDTPPTIGFLTRSAFMAADEIIVPVDTGYFSLHGLSKQLETIRAIREETGKNLTVRIVANQYDVRTKLAREILAELRKRHGDAMFDTFINFNTKLKESSSLGQPITEYDPNSSGCKDFVRFARELISLDGRSADATSLTSLSLEETAAGLSPLTPGAERPIRTISGDAIVAASTPAASAPVRPREGPTPAPAARAAAEVVRPDRSLLDRADALAANAAKLLATTETLLGPGRRRDSASSSGPTTADQTRRKIDLIYGVRAVEDGVIFTVAAAGARSVRVAGDFNDWNPDRTPMMPLREGAFYAELPLGPGRYRYRYVVDGQWLRDPANPTMEMNPYGEMNSVIEVR